MTNIKCTLNCKHNPTGMCTLEEIDMSEGEEMGARFASCNNWEEDDSRIEYRRRCETCDDWVVFKNHLVLTGCSCKQFNFGDKI